jgi:hypothetical protein
MLGRKVILIRISQLHPLPRLALVNSAAAIALARPPHMIHPVHWQSIIQAYLIAISIHFVHAPISTNDTTKGYNVVILKHTENIYVVKTTTHRVIKSAAACKNWCFLPLEIMPVS